MYQRRAYTPAQKENLQKYNFTNFISSGPATSDKPFCVRVSVCLSFSFFNLIYVLSFWQHSTRSKILSPPAKSLDHFDGETGCRNTARIHLCLSFIRNGQREASGIQKANAKSSSAMTTKQTKKFGVEWKFRVDN